MNTKIVGIVACLAAPAVGAQVFHFNYDLLIGGFAVPATFAGTATLDPNSTTIAIDLNMDSPAGTMSGFLASNQDGVNSTLEVLFSLKAINKTFTMPPTLLESTGGTIYTAEFPPDPLTVTISIDYVLREDGAFVRTGSGTFEVAGHPSMVLLDFMNYPANLRIEIPTWGLAPTSSEAIVNLLTPNGSQLILDPFDLLFEPALVPEPGQLAAICAAGLLGYGILRRSRSGRAP